MLCGACSKALTRCTGMAHSWGQRTLRGNRWWGGEGWIGGGPIMRGAGDMQRGVCAAYSTSMHTTHNYEWKHARR